MEKIEYQVFKGLQKPVEFRGLKGRYIKMAIIMTACSVVICFAASPIVGTYASLVLGVIGGVASAFLPATLQRSIGLYSKKTNYGNYIVHEVTREH